MPTPSPIPASRASARPYTRRERPGPITLRLDANEGPPPGDALQQILRETAAEPGLVHAYPDLRPLEAALAERYALRAENVLVTAGADDALARTAQIVLEPGRTALLTRPTFEMIERYIAHAGATALAIDWLGGPFPTADLLAAARDRDPRALYVVSPNNPTGGIAAPDDLRALSSAHPAALLVVDQAYAEFGGEDLTAAALALPNAVVTRTFSKAWGLAGLRVGYALGPAPIIAWMRALGQPYAVSAFAARVAQRWLAEGEAEVRAFAHRIAAERTRLIARLRELGAAALDSEANCVLAKVADAELIATRLAARGIAVRTYPDHPLLANHLRIGLPGDEAHFTTLTTALRDALTPST